MPPLLQGTGTLGSLHGLSKVCCICLRHLCMHCLCLMCWACQEEQMYIQCSCSQNLQGLHYAMHASKPAKLCFCSIMLMPAGYSHITGGYPGGQAQYARVLWGAPSHIPSDHCHRRPKNTTFAGNHL